MLGTVDPASNVEMMVLSTTILSDLFQRVLLPTSTVTLRADNHASMVGMIMLSTT